MPRIVKCGLIQTSMACGADEPIATIRSANLDKTLEFVEQAGREGVQMLCMQEIFTGPYFCAEQNPRWYEAVERIPDGPTVKLMQEQARRHRMVIVVPIYEEDEAGIYYNTAAVIDADGSYLGKYRKNHIPHCLPGFWEKFYFRPGNLGYPVFQTQYGKVGVYICYDRHFPEGARALGLGGAEIVFNPSATVAGLSEYLEARAAGARGREHLLRRRHQSRRHRSAVEHRGILRAELLLRPARQLCRDRFARPQRTHHCRTRLRQDSRSAQHLAVLPRPAAGLVRGAGSALMVRWRADTGVFLA